MGHDLVVLGDLVADLIVPVERLPLLPNNHGWAEGIFSSPVAPGMSSSRRDASTSTSRRLDN